MITSIQAVYADLFQLGSPSCSWEMVTLEQLLIEHGLDYRDGYAKLRELAIWQADDNVTWVRFTHDLYTVTLHEFHRWEDRESGLTVVNQYRIRAEQEIHQ